jgi:hypothetical protein
MSIWELLSAFDENKVQQMEGLVYLVQFNKAMTLPRITKDWGKVETCFKKAEATAPASFLLFFHQSVANCAHDFGNRWGIAIKHTRLALVLAEKEYGKDAPQVRSIASDLVSLFQTVNETDEARLVSSQYLKA